MIENTIDADAGFSLIWNEAAGQMLFETYGKGVRKDEVADIITYLTDLAAVVDDFTDCCGGTRPAGEVPMLPGFVVNIPDDTDDDEELFEVR